MALTPAIIGIVLSAPLLALGVVTVRRWWRLSRGGAATGVLVEHRKRGAMDKHPQNVRAIFDFTTEDGREVQATSTMPAWGGSSRFGREVPVRYDPAAPEKDAERPVVLRFEAALGALAFASGAGFLVLMLLRAMS